MTSFVPLNIIPDSDSEGEVDNTEEIQIEEALKLYQRALKLHTDGAWEEANKAYDDLFQSEIFQLDVEDQVHSRNRTVSSSLPLVHYLAYKNHGSFKLDRLKTVIQHTSTDDVQSEVSQALEWFATALGRDAGDSNLWRETAQLALVISSARLARFALESVLDHETVGADAAKDSLSLVVGGYQNPEDQLALLQLKTILEKMSDNVALSNPSVQRPSKRKLNSKFTKALNPLPWLPLPTAEDTKTLAEEMAAFSEARETVTVTSRTWPAVGKALLERLPRWADVEELDDIPLGISSIHIVLPSQDGEESRETTPEAESPPEAEPEAKVEVAVEEAEDVTMADASHTLLAHELLDRRRSGSANRKRKSTSMGPDAARSRLSKRQRDKKEADAAAAAAAADTPESTQKDRQDTQDEKLFNVVYDCFSPFGVSLGTAAALKIRAPSDTQDTDSAESTDKCELYLDDFKAIMQSWDDVKGNVFLYGDGIQSPAEAAQGMKFLDLEPTIPSRPTLSGDDGLKKFVRDVHKRGLSSSEAAFEWLRALCRRESDAKKSKLPTLSNGRSSYVKHSWPEDLKALVINIASGSEEICCRFFRSLKDTMLARATPEFTPEDHANVEWAETMLELYVDDLATLERLRLGGDLSAESQDEHLIKRDRVFRWFHLVGDLIQCRPRDADGQIEEDELTLRYLWVSAVITGFSDPPREFRLACFEDLKKLLSSHSPIELPNCGIMPEVSSTRAEREISKLKTVDFFSTIFTTASADNQKDPEDVIDILEAVLNPGDVLPYDGEEERMLLEINRFLEGSSAMFKLYLWEKLKLAYEKMNESSKILTCTIKCLEIVMSEVRSKSYLDSPLEYRQFVLLRSVMLAEGMINSSLVPILKDPAVLDGVGAEETIGALKAMATLLQVLHCYMLWESAVSMGEVKASGLHSYRLTQVKLRDLLVLGWVMTYHLYASLLRKGLGHEGGGEWEEGQREERLASLLKELHDELGARNYCKLQEHIFLKMMFDELRKFDDRSNDGDFLQCLSCRFHLTLCSELYYFHDHKTDAEPLTKPIALQIVDFFMYLTQHKKTKELVKSDLKVGLDKLVEVLGIPRRVQSSRIAHNDAMIELYLKTSINPLRLYGALKGTLAVSTVDIVGEYKDIAMKGVYFLQGKIALYPLRYVKKVLPLKVEDVEATIAHFKNDLVCNPDSWETWYRLAQVFEIQTEEFQTWNADAINIRRGELVVVERRCILAYMMAVSLAVKYADSSPETSKIVSELLSDFGFRIYSATRPPMAMESFWVDSFDRHYSGRHGEGMFISRPHDELQLPAALKFAFRLFSLSDSYAPEPCWKTHYMLGKCLAKIDRKRVKHENEISVNSVLQQFVTAITLSPDKTSAGDYIFEPHHKLVSQTTKYVLDGRLDPQEACEIIQATHFARRIPTTDVTTKEKFLHYSIEVFKKLKAGDKPKWHHRMTARLAHLKYDHLGDAAGARAELSCLFGSKTAAISIWRPEHERPGRHFVFASHYTMFYATLLSELGDCAMLELLSKRTRRGTTTLFRHMDVWVHVFDAYIVALRKTYGVPVGCEEKVFSKLVIEEFTATAAKIEQHFLNPAADLKVKPLELLRETFELRRLNGGMAKNPAIDDLLGDAYAWVFDTTKLKLEEKKDNPMSLKNLIFAPEEGASKGGGVRVARRDVVSKAGTLCKGLIDLAGIREEVWKLREREQGDESRMTIGDESLRAEDSRLLAELDNMDIVESGGEAGDEGEQDGGDEMMLG